MSVQEFVIYSGSRVSELLERVFKYDKRISEISCIILELEIHQQALEKFIQREEDSALIEQADQYQIDLFRTINAYKNLEKILLKP